MNTLYNPSIHPSCHPSSSTYPTEGHSWKKKAMLMDIELETVAAIIIKWLSESFKDFMFFISYWYCSLINPTCPFAILSFSPKYNVIIFLLLSQYLHAVTESNARLQHRKTKSFDGNMYECAYQI